MVVSYPPATKTEGLGSEEKSMAVIRGFELKTLERGGVHPTTVDCEWAVFERDGKRLLQPDTYGSDDRKDKGTVSQTLQLDEAGAIQLLDVLRRAFPSIK
jgi:hypothetical protein